MVAVLLRVIQMERLLSKQEVCEATGLQAKELGDALRDETFPAPTHQAKGTRYWTESAVAEWKRRRDRTPKEQRDCFTVAEVAAELQMKQLALFTTLRAHGLLIESPDPYRHNRPTEEGFHRGWFWRVERYLQSERKMVFQTMITAVGRREMLTLGQKLLHGLPTA
jgi:phage antirepressor YoqD-like protein/predicted DNA-binding transcriptional regulator AlpA